MLFVIFCTANQELKIGQSLQTVGRDTENLQKLPESWISDIYKKTIWALGKFATKAGFPNR